MTSQELSPGVPLWTLTRLLMRVKLAKEKNLPVSDLMRLAEVVRPDFRLRRTAHHHDRLDVALLAGLTAHLGQQGPADCPHAGA